MASRDLASSKKIIALHFARVGPKNSPIYAYQLEFVF